MNEGGPPKGEEKGGGRKRRRGEWAGGREGGGKKRREGEKGVVGSLSRSWEVWRDWLGERKEVLAWVREGLRFYPKNAEKLMRKGSMRPILLDMEQREWAVGELERLVKSGAVLFLGEGESMPEGLWFASPVFTVPKPKTRAQKVQVGGGYEGIERRFGGEEVQVREGGGVCKFV